MWTAILTGRLAGSPSSHSTATRRSLSRTFLTTVRQSRACTVSPRPRVMNPTIPSPGTGERHLPKRARTPSQPPMRTGPAVFLAAFAASRESDDPVARPRRAALAEAPQAVVHAPDAPRPVRLPRRLLGARL